MSDCVCFLVRIVSPPPDAFIHYIRVSSSAQHWFDSHGDSICTEEMGGLACYLREEPEGYVVCLFLLSFLSLPTFSFALRSEKDQKIVDRRDQMTGK